MIERHKYIDGTLYLYFDYNYEFGKFNIMKKSRSYIDTIKDYIKKLNYQGNKIVIMVGSIMVAILTLNNGTLSIDNDILIPKSEEKVEYTIDELEDYNIVIEEQVVENKDNYKIQEEKVDAIEEISKNEKINDIKTENDMSTNDNISKQAEQINNEISDNINDNGEEKTNNIIEHKLENPIVLIHNGTSIEIELEDYVIGVVAAEMPASFNKEALKAQSVIARTYALKLKNEGKTLTDNNSTQNYIDVDQMKIKWGSDFDKYYNKIVDSVNATKGITIKYNGQYIDSVYHSTSNGYTEDAINVWKYDIPYLKSVDSEWDKSATSYKKDITIDLDTFNNLLGISISSIDEIENIQRNSSNRVEKIKVGDKNFTGIDFRNIFGLRSTDFDIELIDNNIIITTRGYGHGVGLSQYGANGMANSGYNYIDILNHYYTNVQIK